MAHCVILLLFTAVATVFLQLTECDVHTYGIEEFGGELIHILPLVTKLQKKNNFRLPKCKLIFFRTSAFQTRIIQSKRIQCK